MSHKASFPEVPQYNEIFEGREREPDELLKELAEIALGERDLNLADFIKQNSNGEGEALSRSLGDIEVERRVPDHDVLHMERVIASGRTIVEKDFANDPRTRKIVEAILILHDIITHPKNSDGYKDEAQESADYSQNLLQICGYEKDEIRDILQGIAQISYIVNNGTPETPDAKIAFDADKLDQFGVIGLLRYVSTSGQQGRPHFNEADPLHRTDRKLHQHDNTLDARFIRLPQILDRLATNAGKEVAQRRYDFEQGMILREIELEIAENKEHKDAPWATASGAMLIFKAFEKAGKERRSFYEPKDPFGEEGRPLDAHQYPLDALIIAARDTSEMGMPGEIAERRRQFLNDCLTELKRELAGE